MDNNLRRRADIARPFHIIPLPPTVSVYNNLATAYKPLVCFLSCISRTLRCAAAASVVFFRVSVLSTYSFLPHARSIAPGVPTFDALLCLLTFPCGFCTHSSLFEAAVLDPTSRWLAAYSFAISTKIQMHHQKRGGALRNNTFSFFTQADKYVFRSSSFAVWKRSDMWFKYLKPFASNIVKTVPVREIRSSALNLDEKSPVSAMISGTHTISPVPPFHKGPTNAQQSLNQDNIQEGDSKHPSDWQVRQCMGKMMCNARASIRVLCIQNVKWWLNLDG